MKKLLLLIVLVMMSAACVREVMGRPWDDEGQCWGEEQVMGEIFTDHGNDISMIVKGDDGRYWEMTGDELPDGFSFVRGAALEDIPDLNAPKCP